MNIVEKLALLCLCFVALLIFVIYMNFTLFAFSVFVFVSYCIYEIFISPVNILRLIAFLCLFFLSEFVFIVYTNGMNFLDIVCFICFVFVSAFVTGVLCFLIFDREKMERIYEARKDKKLSRNDVNLLRAVFVCSIFFVLAVISYMTMLSIKTLKDNDNFYSIRILYVYICTYLIVTNFLLISDEDRTKQPFYTVFFANIVFFVSIEYYLY